MPPIILSVLFCILLSCAPCRAADVLIIADAQLKPVMEASQGIRKTLRASTRTFAPGEVKGSLAAVLQRENARLVIALGREALSEALSLPSPIPVIYGMVVTPPPINRPNTAGFYLATPSSTYSDLIRNHLPVLKHVAVVSSNAFLSILAGNLSAPIIPHPVKNAAEFVSTLKRLTSSDAILLLPDSSVMSSAAMEEAFLFSFRQRIPLLGVSERHVKEGALLALVVDMVNSGKVMGEYATRALKSGNLGQPPASPPQKFDLYLNLDTARKMRISIPDELIRMARKTYP